MKLTDFALSQYGKVSSTPSPVNRMMAAFAADFRPDKDINLGVGYINEGTIPRELILESMRQVLARPEKYKLALNYGGPQGSPNLISSIKNFLVQNKKGCLTENILDRKEIIIGPNGATSLLEAVAHVLKPGIVITPDPMYYIFCNYLERLGFEVLTVPEDPHGIRTDLFKEKLQKLGSRKQAISFIYVVTINNPTGSIMSNERRASLVGIVTELSKSLERKIPLIFDKAYEDLVHDESVGPLESGLLYDELGLVYETGTVSKILSPALRIGYMIGNDGPFLRALIQKTSDVGFSAPLITQEIASYMLDHHILGQIQRVNQGYREKAQEIKKLIEGPLSDFLEQYSGGKAGFYFYLTFDKVQTNEGSAFFNYLARTTGNTEIDGPFENKNPRVIYVPGQFCVHPKGDLVEKGQRQLRISYGFENLDKLKKAVKLMHEAAKYILA